MDIVRCVQLHCEGLKASSIREIETSARFFAEFLLLRKIELEQLNQYDICAFVTHLRQRRGVEDANGNSHYTNRTIRRHLYTLRALCRIAKVDEEAWTRAFKLVPLSKIPEKREFGRLEWEQIESLLKGLPASRTGHQLAAFIGLTYGGGLRRGEVLKIRLGEIRVIHNRLIVKLRKTKNGKDYAQVIGPELVQYVLKAVSMRNAEGAKESDFLLTSRAGKVYHGRSINKLLAFWASKTIGQHISTHWGRYSSITRLLEQGYTYREVQEFSRHASVEMVELYDQREFGEDDHPGNFLKFKK